MAKNRTKNCRWHQCGAEFTPECNRQEFCGPKCGRKYQSWAKTRGAVIVNALLNCETIDQMEKIGRVQYRKLHEERRKGLKKGG